jgi:enoyl-[acyl-carrier protein] reductase/trans-2-enoyl-CoA reductase (NAD+)
MKQMGLHEGCIEQMARLYKDRLYADSDPAKTPVDSDGRIRIDDLEMREDVQAAVRERMKSVTQENVYAETDVEGFKHDFLEVHGFDVEGVDYNADVDPVNF